MFWKPILCLFLMATVPFTAVAAEKPDATALVFWAEWCGGCKILDPALEKAVGSYDNGVIDIVRIDYTDLNLDNVMAEADKAIALGVADLVPVTNVSTGYALLIVDQEVKGKISAGMTVEMIHDVFDLALLYRSP